MMCRLVAYLGHPVLLDQVLVKPINSIVMQSLHARESIVPTNGDGFGVGWYAPDIDDTPALFTSISPAWNNQNLLSLTTKIKSPAFFAHVRAASSGGVTQYNCHPFVFKNLMMMHNGEIGEFIKIKRHLRRELDDDIYNWIKGETDSEHLFALFLQLAKKHDLTKVHVMANVLEDTFKELAHLTKKFSINEASHFNVCLTNGQHIVASRFCTNPTVVPETMHYALGTHFLAKDGGYHMLEPFNTKPGCALIVSEKLTNFDAEWHEVPANHLILLDSNFKIQLRPL